MRRDCGVVGVVIACMRSHPFAGMKNLHGGRGEPGFQLLARQLIGNAVIITVHVHVVIDRGADRLPIRHSVGLDRQGLQGRTIEFGKQAGAGTLAFPERPVIELLQQLGDGFVKFGQGVKTSDDGERR